MVRFEGQGGYPFRPYDWVTLTIPFADCREADGERRPEGTAWQTLVQAKRFQHGLWIVDRLAPATCQAMRQRSQEMASTAMRIANNNS